MNAQEAGLLADFLILAVKPEGDNTDYKLVEIGDTKINAGLLGVVINTLPLGFLGLDDSTRTYDEGAELAQCRAACRSNGECRDFEYVRPNASQPVGVCHLKRYAENASYGVMTPVVGPGEGTIITPPSHEPTREPTPTASTRDQGDRIVFDDTEKSGRVSYAGDDARATPLSLKFLAPVSNVKVYVRTADYSEGRIMANVDAYNARGRSVGHAGTWISAGKYNFNHAITVATEGDRIAVVKITAGNGMLAVDGIEFTRALITPPPVVAYPETPPVVAEEPYPPPREENPYPPRIPPVVAMPMPLPPRVVAEIPTAPPRVITTTPETINPPPPLPVTIAPAVTAPEPRPEPAATQAEPAPPPALTPVALPPIIGPAPQPRRGLPIWAVAAAIAFMLGGAGTYWHSHRRKMLTRIATRLVSNGLDRQTVTVEGADRPDVSLRFVVRAAATVGAPGTRIDLIPAGALA